ncbi:hypothetical protein [Sphingobium sp. KCTC 72723]|uniref:hypothetical protein n=1 Tax=Sphingobium sp. KCTC 72723 TaxID=2733867 RepID=UPI00165E78CE|nr:hypothetical protein [Sphingobium sp. KCTC 72723]
MPWQTILSKTVELPVAGVVRAGGDVLLGFPSGPAQWGVRLYIDGALLWSAQGNSLQVSQHVGGRKACEAGPCLVELQWSAAPTVTLHSAYLEIDGLPNTVSV